MTSVVLVTGANGFIGRSVCTALLHKDYRVRAFTRGPFEMNGVEHMSGDMRDLASLERAMAGVTYVVHLAAMKNDEPESEEVNVGGAKNLIEACRITGVKRIVNISTQSAKLERIGLYGWTKKKADELLHASAIETVTLRSSLVYGNATGGILGAIARYAALPVIPMTGPGTAHFRPIHRDDLADIVAHSLTQPGMAGKTYDVGGPDSLSFNEIAEKILKARGVRRPILHLPVWLSLWIAHACRFLLSKPPLTVSNVLGSAVDVPMDTRPLHEDLPGLTPRHFDDGLREIFGPAPEKAAMEARALLRYALSSVGHWEPADADIQRYRAALRAHGIPEEGLHESLVRSRFKLGAADAATMLRRPQSMLRKKLLVAAAIAETSPASAEALLPKERSIARLFVRSADLTMSALLKYILSIPLLIRPSRLEHHAA